MKTRSNAASVVAVLLPWTLAAAGLLFGAVMWVGSRHENEVAGPSSAGDPKEISTLRAALASANSANQTLLRELDRLRASRGPAAAPAADTTAAAGGTEPKGPTSEQEELGKRLKDALPRAAGGDPYAKQEVAQAIWELLRSGAGSAAVLRDAYLSATDPHARGALLGSLIFSGAAEARDLIVDQVDSEEDPQLRGLLMSQAARYATGDYAAALTPTFIQSIDSDDDPQTRIAAIRGLQYAPGLEAPEALMRAAADPSEDVRIAAMDVLASRPAADETLRSLLAKEPSSRVREFAQCRLVVAQALR